MDYFDSGLNNDQSELPQDFNWDDMKDGIYEKMETNNKPSTIKKYWPLLLLLLIAGCGSGSWFAINYFNAPPTEIDRPVAVDQQNNLAPLGTDTKSSTNVKSIDIDKVTSMTSADIHEKEITKKSIVKNKITQTTTPKTNNDITHQSTSNNNDLLYTITVSESSLVQEKKNEPTTQNNKSTAYLKINSLAFSTTSWAQLNDEPTIKLNQVKTVLSDYSTNPNNKKPKEPTFKKYVELSLGGGIINWIAFDNDNINHDFSSGFPSYTFNPSISLSFKPNQAIQIDYEYSSLEELFDYEGSRDIEVPKEDVVVKNVVSSLTGNVISDERKDLLLQGTRYNRELKYNQYKLHALSIGYRFEKSISKRFALGAYVGGSYLLNLNTDAKRLDEAFDVVAYDNTNSFFQKNQFGLRLGCHTNFQLSAHTQLFSQIVTTKYMTNWEVNTSGSSTQPLLYSLQVGVRYRLKK